MRYFIPFKVILFSVSFLASNNALCSLLDKIALVIDSNVVTLSELQRIKETLPARNEISPQIYASPNLSEKELAEVLIQTNIVRSKLSGLGYIINDEQVEDQIESTETRLGLSRDALLGFLSSKGLTFEEYFEITRETIEFNIFYARVISPLISISEQEIKNTFFNNYTSDKTLSFKYNLTDYSIKSTTITKESLDEFSEALNLYQSTGVIPEKFKDMETTVLGDIQEEGLASDLKAILKGTDEGALTKPILLSGEYHIFLVNKKDVVESELYLAAKDEIRNKLLEERAKKVLEFWNKREANSHFIRQYI